MDAVVALIQNKPIQAVCSVLTLTEVLPVPLRTGNTALADRYRNILLNSREFLTFSVTSQIAEAAADLRARYQLRTPDALHIATVLESGCDAILTNDIALKRVIEITILALDDLEADDPPPA